MTIREELLQSYRQWAKDVLGLTDSQVILPQRGAMGPRPALPFLMLNFVGFDIPKGVDEMHFNENGDVVWFGTRMAGLRVEGIGDDTEEWLTLLGMKVSLYTGPSTIIHQATTIADISNLVNAAEYESRYMREFDVEYGVRIIESSATVMAESVEVTNNAGSPVITKVITVELV
jgi:hypothetical protein